MPNEPMTPEQFTEELIEEPYFGSVLIPYVIDYMTVRANTVKLLNEKVVQMIEKGWQPMEGGAFTAPREDEAGVHWCQTMVQKVLIFEEIEPVDDDEPEVLTGSA